MRGKNFGQRYEISGTVSTHSQVFLNSGSWIPLYSLTFLEVKDKKWRVPTFADLAIPTPRFQNDKIGIGKTI